MPEVSEETVGSISTPDWLQTVPGKGWWTILRLYAPEATFFDKTWQPTEIEPI